MVGFFGINAFTQDPDVTRTIHGVFVLATGDQITRCTTENLVADRTDINISAT